MLRWLAVLLLCCSPLFSQTPPPFAAAARQIESVVKSGAVPGMAVAVTQHGHIVWEQGFGWADRERRIRATANTPFYLASVTKSITATALMALRGSGKLDLNRPINDYLGTAKVHSPMWDASQATVWRVATHTAGLTTFYRACDVGDPRCRISVKEEIERYGILFWPPGERFDYSNLGYTLLGEAMANVAQQSFASVLRNSVFVPLGMSHCGLDGAPGAAANYDEHSHKRAPQQISGTPGASAVYCTAHDLALFAMFHLKDHLPSQRQIVPEAAIDELHRAVTHQPDQQYAMGWWTEQRDGEHIVFGQGGTTDSFALLELFPTEDVGVVLLANSWSDTLNMPNAIEQAIVAPLLPHFHSRPQPQSTASVQAPSNPVSQHMVGEWAGEIQTYRGALPVALSIGPAGGVHGQLGSGAKMALRSVSIKGTHLYGVLSADLRDPDAPRCNEVEFDLYLRGSKLAGAVTTRPVNGSSAQLPHWTELQKANP